MEILYTVRFKKDFHKLPKQIQLRALEREEWFLADPFDPRLKTHSLNGKLSKLYSFSITDSYRILFGFGEGRKVAEFFRIGRHDIYD
ncbi:MAG: plasmid stabilization protein [Parcubacteria group bacterium]|nr:plasmid stabilization protein [Parcubacteria group bacterium]